jgi:hypothetical protein
MIIRLTRFRATVWRCRLCGETSTFKADLCEPVEVKP